MEGFQMHERHRDILIKGRVYLLHNLRPSETLWAGLICKEIFSPEMVEEMKSHCRLTEQVSHLLDLLPARGPEAFDQFCDVLLESDHTHVAEYLKTMEATDQFRMEVQPHCQDHSEYFLERLVNVFKKSTPTVQRFAERKFEIFLVDQERDIEQREVEYQEMENQNRSLQAEVNQFRSFMNTCIETTGDIANQVQQKVLSGSVFHEAANQLQDLHSQVKDIPCFKKECKFYENMQTLLSFLEKYSKPLSQFQTQDGRCNSGHLNIKLLGRNGSLFEKLKGLGQFVTDLIECLGNGLPNISKESLKTELEKLFPQIQAVKQDIHQVQSMFKTTIQQKETLQDETLSLLHHLKEIRRLERELKEKQGHRTELSQHGQTMKKKVSQQQRRMLQQIQLNIKEKEIQMNELQRALERQLTSADHRMQSLLHLLPDLNHNDNLVRRNSELFSLSSNSLGALSDKASGAPSILQRDLMKMAKQNQGFRPSSGSAEVEQVDKKEDRTENSGVSDKLQTCSSSTTTCTNNHTPFYLNAESQNNKDSNFNREGYVGLDAGINVSKQKSNTSSCVTEKPEQKFGKSTDVAHVHAKENSLLLQHVQVPEQNRMNADQTLDKFRKITAEMDEYIANQGNHGNAINQPNAREKVKQNSTSLLSHDQETTSKYLTDQHTQKRTCTAKGSATILNFSDWSHMNQRDEKNTETEKYPSKGSPIMNYHMTEVSVKGKENVDDNFSNAKSLHDTTEIQDKQLSDDLHLILEKPLENILEDGTNSTGLLKVQPQGQKHIPQTCKAAHKSKGTPNEVLADDVNNNHPITCLRLRNPKHNRRNSSNTGTLDNSDKEAYGKFQSPYSRRHPSLSPRKPLKNPSCLHPRVTSLNHDPNTEPKTLQNDKQRKRFRSHGFHNTEQYKTECNPTLVYEDANGDVRGNLKKASSRQFLNAKKVDLMLNDVP